MTASAGSTRPRCSSRSSTPGRTPPSRSCCAAPVSRRAKGAALEWLERLDIGDRTRCRPHELTQSERQRVCVARALAPAPSVLFADEPTAPLHRADRAHVLRTLTTAARSHGITVVLATHDPDTAALADRTLTLLDGRRVNTVHLPPMADSEGRTACSLSV